MEIPFWLAFTTFGSAAAALILCVLLAMKLRDTNDRLEVVEALFREEQTAAETETMMQDIHSSVSHDLYTPNGDDSRRFGKITEVYRD